VEILGIKNSRATAMETLAVKGSKTAAVKALAVKGSKVDAAEMAETQMVEGRGSDDLSASAPQCVLLHEGEVMRSRQLALVASLILGVIGLSASALATTIFYAANEAIIDQVLGEMELEYELLLDEYGDPIWTFTHLGILITIVSYDEVVPGHYASLLFYTGWAADDEVSLAMINDWNKGSRFGRAYMDDSGDPVIELDLLLAGGVTADTIQQYITVFAEAASSLGVALQL